MTDRGDQGGAAGLQPGLALNDSAALLDPMVAEAASRRRYPSGLRTY